MDAMKRSSTASGTGGVGVGGGFVRQYTKLDFPCYSGEKDPLPSLNRCDHFFWHQRTAEEEKEPFTWKERNRFGS